MNIVRNERSIFNVNFHNPEDVTGKFGHIDYAPGWHPLIKETFEKLIYLCKCFDIEEIKIAQIKEKFGVLRMYIGFSYSENNEHMEMQSNILHTIISHAENRSRSICLKSGEYGEMRNVKGWYATLSDEEYEKELKKRK